MDLLALLLGKRGDLVTREEIVNRVWGPAFFIEAEAGINTAIRKVRQALRDSPDKSAYVETVPGKGYRFIGTVQGPRLVTLAVLPARLRVIGRTSMMAYQATSKSLSEIGQALGAEYLVESSLRAEGRLLCITCRLIRAHDQVQLWCQSFDQAWGSSILQLQRQLSFAIASQISWQLSLEKLSAIVTRHTQSGEAYDLYLLGRFLWHRLSGETTRNAIEHYKRAVALDPLYGLAWAGLSVAFAGSPITGDVPAL